MADEILNLFKVYPVQMIATAPERKKKRQDFERQTFKPPKSAFFGALLKAENKNALP